MRKFDLVAIGRVAFTSTVILVGVLATSLSPISGQNLKTEQGIESVYVNTSPEWLGEDVRNWLNDHCACVVPEAVDAGATLTVSLTDRAGRFPDVRLISLNARLEKGGIAVWEDSRKWTAAGEGAARKAATGLANGLLSSLLPRVELPNGNEVKYRFLQQVLIVGIVADGYEGADWVPKLQGSQCRQKVVAGNTGGAILKHLEVQSGSVGENDSITVNCSSTYNSIDCEDNVGGSSSVYCEGGNCSATSTSGFDPNVDARPDIEITAPKFAWVFIDPKTGQDIGTWSLRKNSLAAVKKVLGCTQ